MSRETVTCPDCNGRGHSPAHLYTTSGGRWEPEHPRSRCGGTGSIPAEQLAWIEHGERLRTARKESYRTLRQEAQRRGLKAVEWSDIEWGRVENLEHQP